MNRTTFTGAALEEISFPLGGIGTGCIGLAGNGRLIDWEIFNRPNKGGLNGNTHFAIKVQKREADGTATLLDARVLHGDTKKNLTGERAQSFGMGLSAETMAGFPHFRGCSFTGEFPFAWVELTEEGFPGTVRLTAWNPLIPLNDKDSGIPAAFLAYAVTNTTNETLEYSLSAAVRNPYDGAVNTCRSEKGIHAIFFGQNRNDTDNPTYGDLTIATDSQGDVSWQQYWYRGDWHDGLERYWRNFTEQDVYENRIYDTPGSRDMANLAVKKTIAPGETACFRFVLSWSSPNCYNYWSRYTVKDENGSEKDVTWKNYYATLFADSYASAVYGLQNWDRLYDDTKTYHDSLFSVSLPEEVVEAISATTSVLKTPTVLRLENGEFYGWEGVWEHGGSCEGTCTHVWNYAYALCFLFPNLERTIRETDFMYNQDEYGRMVFRMTLPLGRQRGGFRACVDGQMGGVIKTYREWKLCGDDEWLRGLWDGVKKSLEYAWSEQNPDRWDLDKDGVMEGRQHHTLDMELFGPSSWLEGFYLAALLCGAEMAERMGEVDTAAEYRALYEKGKAWSDEHLFNGKWYAQQVDLTDKAILEGFGALNYWNEESGEIKYQIGQGCIIDQCLAQWHANLCGIGEIYDKTKLHTALESLYKNNYMSNMRAHYNTFRLYALDDEAATIICSYPKEVQTPAIPIPYAQESMHGFEYSLAGLMVSEGMIKEGCTIVKAVRDRYRGYNRNPWNEIECGSNYARSMASFALLPIWTGYSFRMQDKTLGFAPIVDGNFNSMWFVDAAWGTYSRVVADVGCTTVLTVKAGKLPLAALDVPYYGGVESVLVDGKPAAFAFAEGKITFAADAVVEGTLTIIGK